MSHVHTGSHAVGGFRLKPWRAAPAGLAVVLAVAVVGLVPAAHGAGQASVEITAAWPGEKGPVIKVEAYPVLSRVVDEETEEVKAKLGKRQTYAYLRPHKRVLAMPLEAGTWRLVIQPDETRDEQHHDVDLRAGSVRRIHVALGKIIAAPRTVGGRAMPSKVEVYRGEKRVFYGYSKPERKNVVVSLFPGRLTVRINGNDETRNFLASQIRLSAGAKTRVGMAFGEVRVRSAMAKAKYEFFQRMGGERTRILYRYTKPGRRGFVVHLRPGRYEVDVTNEQTDRKTTRRIDVSIARTVSLD